MARVCIPEYVGPQVVAGARVLHQDGDDVTLATWTKGEVLGKYKSKAFHSVHEIPLPRTDPDDFRAAIRRLHGEKDFDAIIPFGLQSFQALTLDPERETDALPVMLPTPDVFHLLNSKSNLTAFANELGIDTPRIYPMASEADLGAIARDARFPLVVKVVSGSGVTDGLRYSNNADELKVAWAELSEKGLASSGSAPELMVQEYVPGRIHDACTITVHGRPVQILTQVRQLMYPIYGGVGAINITTDDEKLRALARRILERSGYHGTAQIEFKLDPRDGSYRLIEFNPKLWGTLVLSLKAGIRFPALVRDYLQGKPLPENQPYPVGYRYNFWYPLAVLAKLQLLRDFGVKGLFGIPRGTRQFNHFEWWDYRPDLHRMLMTLKLVLGRNFVDVNRNISKDLIPVPWDEHK